MHFVIFREILNEKSVQEFHLYQKFLIVITGNAQNQTSSLNDVFQLLWNNGLINSHVLIQDKTQSWSLYTFLPCHDDCITLSQLKIESFTRFNHSNLMNLSISQAYPKKLQNFNGCPWYIVPNLSSPYVIPVKTTNGMYKFDGADCKIVNDILKILNITADYRLLLNKTENGTFIIKRPIPELFSLVIHLAQQLI